MALEYERFYTDAAKTTQDQRNDLFPFSDVKSNDFVADLRP